MKNYIEVNGRQIPLTEDQIREIAQAYEQKHVLLSDVPEGDVASIGGHDFIVLGHYDGETALITKDILATMKFGDNNNFYGSVVDAWCESLAEDLAAAVGDRNLVLHALDLTSDDGLRDYGAVQRYVSLLTAERYRMHVNILDKHKPDSWWWLATPHSTGRHGDEYCVRCVSPSGFLNYYHCFYLDRGVRPFCILKSDIFVSI